MNEFDVFKRLNRNEDRTHDEGEYEPFDHSPFLELEEATGSAGLVPFGSPDTELAGYRAQDEDDRIHKSEGDVQLRRFRCPQFGQSGTQCEVHCEESGEEHHLA